MKEYQVNLYGKTITIIQDTDGKFVTPEIIKEQNKFGTTLKPAYEPIIVARKPFNGSLVDNVIKNGVGGINIDECRVELEKNETIANNIDYKDEKQSNGWGTKKCITEQSNQGRFPANVILTYDETDFNEVCGGMPDENGLSASRYFYCAKASKKDRDEGLDLFEEVNGGIYQFRQDGSLDGQIPTKKNIHPTVKPVELMQ